MNKKIEAASRPCVTMQETGGGLVAIFSTGTYECLKQEILRYFEASIKSGLVLVTPHQDKAGHTLDLSIKVQSYEVDSPVDEPVVDYVVNLYNTTSKALINGKRPHLFVNVMRKIAHKVDFNLVNRINNTLINLERVETYDPMNGARRSARPKKPTLKAIDAKPKSKPTTTKSDLDRSSCNGDILQRPTLQNETQSCKSCQRNIRSKAVICQECNLWVHYNCDGLGAMEIKRAERGESYTCKACTIIFDDEEITNSSSQMTNSTSQIDQHEDRKTKQMHIHNQLPTIAYSKCTDFSPSESGELTQEAVVDTCPLCSEELNDACVHCNICDQWLHYQCENFTNEDIHKLDCHANKYTCKSCVILLNDEGSHGAIQANKESNKIESKITSATEIITASDITVADIVVSSTQATPFVQSVTPSSQSDTMTIKPLPSQNTISNQGASFISDMSSSSQIHILNSQPMPPPPPGYNLAHQTLFPDVAETSHVITMPPPNYNRSSHSLFPNIIQAANARPSPPPGFNLNSQHLVPPMMSSHHPQCSPWSIPTASLHSTLNTTAVPHSMNSINASVSIQPEMRPDNQCSFETDADNIKKEFEAKIKKLNARERQLKNKEAAIKKREDELGEQSEQMILMKSLVTKLEQKIEDLEEANRMLKLKLIANSDTFTQHDSQPTISSDSQPTISHSSKDTQVQPMGSGVTEILTTALATMANSLAAVTANMVKDPQRVSPLLYHGRPPIIYTDD